MENTLDVLFDKTDAQGQFGLFNALYRKALIDIGLSPDTHVYDLKFQFLARRGTASARFLLLSLYYYLDLCKEERRIFVNDVLERGRHYRFWWLEFHTPEEYSELKRSFYSKRRMMA